MALFSDYSFDDLIGDLDFSYPVGTETSGDLTVDDSGPSFLDEIYGDMIGGFDNYDEDPPWTEIFGPSYQFLDNDFDDYSWLDDILQGDEDYSADDIIGMTDEDLAAAIAGGGDEDVWQGPFGWGIIPGIRNTIFGQGEGPLGGNVLGGGGILGQILGFGGAGGAGAAGGGQGGEGGEAGIGGLLSGLGGGNPLLSFLAMKSLLKDEPKGVVPVGEQAYGQAQPFNYQDYQPTNLQPALMPGVGYANVGAPGMQSGGLAMPSSADLERMRQNVLGQPGLTSGLEMEMPSFARPEIRVEVEEPSTQEILAAIQNDQVVELGDGSVAVAVNGQYTIISPQRLAEVKDHSNKSGIIAGSGSLSDVPGFEDSNLATLLDRMAEDSYAGMQSGGTVRPGDVTFAKLEPGEFVIQKPAVDAVGIETLEQINNMGNGRPYYG